MKKKRSIRRVLQFVSLAAYILIALSAAAATPRTVKICVLRLFKPAQIVLTIERSDVGISPYIDGEPRAEFTMSAGGKAIIKSSGEKLSLSGIRNGREIFSADNISRLEFSPGGVQGAPFLFSLEIQGKIKRGYSGAPGFRPAAGGITTAVGIQLEDYVKDVVLSETGGEMDGEALKAFAVVVRSYAASQGSRHGNLGCDFCDTTHCQLYLGADSGAALDPSKKQKLLALIEETAGEILIHQGKPLMAHYTPACPGYTADTSVIWGSKTPGIMQVKCPFHDDAPKYFPWERKVEKTKVIEALSKTLKTELPPDTRIHVSRISEPGGYAGEVTIAGGEIRETMTGDGFRMAMGQSIGWSLLLSNAYTVKEDGDSLIFTGRGFGHGVGLCQLGARRMADRGNSYVEILEFYFPQASLSKLE